MENEMNFFDFCAACGRAIGRGFAAIGRLIVYMTRLTYRYWWLVITVLVLAAGAALYYTRSTNLIYRMNAVALLNGPSVQQFEQAYAPLRANKMLPEDAAIKPFLENHQAKAFDTYRVIDCLHDGNADFIDFKRKITPTDTVQVMMNDRLCLQFRIKARDLDLVPEIEAALLDLLNANEPMQSSYATYLANLREEVAFNHSQALKLDSLTSSYYFNPTNAQPMSNSGSGVNFYGERRIRLFLDEIYEQREYLQKCDYRLQLATAPVVLENHFAMNPKQVNGRLKVLVVFLLLGWCFGCAVAEIIDKRKAISAWLKK